MDMGPDRPSPRHGSPEKLNPGMMGKDHPVSLNLEQQKRRPSGPDRSGVGKGRALFKAPIAILALDFPEIQALPKLVMLIDLPIRHPIAFAELMGMLTGSERWTQGKHP